MWTQIHRGESHVKTRQRSERGTYRPRSVKNPKDCQQPAEAGRGRRDFSLEPLEGEQPHQHLDLDSWHPQL